MKKLIVITIVSVLLILTSSLIHAQGFPPLWQFPNFYGQYAQSWGFQPYTPRYFSSFNPIGQYGQQYQPYYNVPYGWNQSYNSDGYSYFSHYEAEPYNGYYGYGYYSYTPGSLQRAGNYQKANGSNTPFPSESEYSIYEYPMYYEGDQIMELSPRNPAFPPFLKFDGTDIIIPSSSDDSNILNPESPLYYLNPSSPYYEWGLPERGSGPGVPLLL